MHNFSKARLLLNLLYKKATDLTFEKFLGMCGALVIKDFVWGEFLKIQVIAVCVAVHVAECCNLCCSVCQSVSKAKAPG